MALTAVVLAGGPRDAVAELQPGAPNKAFVRVAGVTLVERTLRALRASDAIGTIIAVAPREMHGDSSLALADERRDDGPSIGDSLKSGLRGLDPAQAVLVAASDLPVLSSAAIAEFARITRERDAWVTYACVERGVHEQAYPEVPHTWARMREGSFCGGGTAALRPAVLPALEGFLDRLGSARKNPLALAGILGLDLMLRYASGTLGIADAERRAADLLGAPAAAAVCEHPEIAVNVDRPEDVALAEAILARTAR